MQLSTHLQFSGQCEAAFRFYEKCLGGRITFLMTYGDSPMAEQAPPEWQKKIVHASFAQGEQTLSGADSWAEHCRTPQGFSVVLEIKAATEAERTFAALAENATVQMPIQETFLGAAIRHPVDDQLQQARLRFWSAPTQRLLISARVGNAGSRTVRDTLRVELVSWVATMSGTDRVPASACVC
jgi:PhnB protein